MEAGERLVEKMGLYATEQEVMDMQPFVKDALEELRRQQPVAARGLVLHEEFAECHARLQVLAERIEGLREAAPAPATMENSHQVPLTSTPTKRKKDEGTTMVPSPAKVIKVEKDDDERSTPEVPPEPNCSPQPHTSSSAPTMPVIRESPLLNSIRDSSDEMHDSDSDLLNVGSDEEDSIDEESLDPSLLDDFSNILEDSTNRNNPHFPICLQDTLDVGQGYVVFFDVKILKNEVIQMAVVDNERILTALIRPTVCLPNSMAKTNGYEVGLSDLLGHLRTIYRPILAAFGLWSLPLPTLLKTLTDMGKKEEFFSVVYRFLDVLPMIKEKVPEMNSCRLKCLARNFLQRDLSNCSTMESASAIKDLCDVLEIDLENEPSQLLKPASLDAFMSLQPLLERRLLSRPSAQTLASHGIGLPKLHACFMQNPIGGLPRMCAMVNACRHRFETRVRHLSKVKAYFQQQPPAASSHASP
ncbi:protein PML-like [Numida meleagris]|uniref:protein PML-like n=1 Tax=Numida meleagris TaxID=8996 RepID=UPI000B3DEEBC|nr:protein PML-like [Numida meleagris]